MGTAAPQEFTPEQKEAFFGEILRLYDLTDEVVNAIGTETAINRALQLELAAPLIEQANATIDTFSRIYTEIVRDGHSVTPEQKSALQEAFHNYLLSLDHFSSQVKEQLLN